MKKIYSTTVIGQAEMLQVVLRNYGIESRLENEGAANYAIGLPTAAAPISIVVDDERAEEAARIVAEEFTRPRAPEPTAIMIQMPCACGKTLEFPKGEEPPAICPWCNRPTQAAPDPDQVPPSASGSRIVAAILVAVGLLVVVGLFGGYYGIQKAIKAARRTADASASSGETHQELVRRLQASIDAIPTPTMPAVDPEAIVAEMTKALPEDAPRYSAALQQAATIGDLVDRWLELTAELSPDWAVDSGFVETRRLGRYSTKSLKGHVLVNALTLRKLRSMSAEAGSLDGRLLERHLERLLLSHVLFGTELSDPRAALWGFFASYRHKDQAQLIAERLEELPAVVDEVRRELRNVDAPTLEMALKELNEAMEMFRDLETSSKDPRLLAAVTKARNALAEYATHLRKMKDQAQPPPPGDPRWILFLAREGEFSTRTARQTAAELLAEAERALPKWNAQGGSVHPTTESYPTPEKWRAEISRCVVLARELTLAKNFVDVPEHALPEVIESPLLSRGTPEETAYSSRALQPRLHGQLWVTGWETSGAAAADLSSKTAQVNTMAETYPGRHVHALVSRRDGTRMRRLYFSHSLSEGWRSYAHRWATQTVPNARYEAVYADGVRFSQAWCAAVEICYLAGTLSEREAVDLIVGATSDSEDQARVRLAYALGEPLHSAGAVLGELDIVALRTEMEEKLGSKFDLKRFHTRLLGYGRAPIALIRQEMLRDAK